MSGVKSTFLKPCFKPLVMAGEGIPGEPGTEEEYFHLHVGHESGFGYEMDSDGFTEHLFSLLTGERTMEEIIAEMQRFDPTTTVDEVHEVVVMLTEQGLLYDADILSAEYLPDDFVETHNRHCSYLLHRGLSGEDANFFLDELRSVVVTIIGLGGLGSQVAFGLVKLGIRHIRGVDPDQVAISNLARSFYLPNAVGVPKITALYDDYLRHLDAELIFSGMQEVVTSWEQLAPLIADSDLVILCADSPAELPRWLNKAALVTGVPYIMAGYQVTTGEIGPFVVPRQSRCLECLMGDYKEPSAPPKLAWLNERAREKHPSDPTLTSLITAYICSEVQTFFIRRSQKPFTLGKIYTIDPLKPSITELETPGSGDCGCRSREWQVYPSEKVRPFTGTRVQEIGLTNGNTWTR